MHNMVFEDVKKLLIQEYPDYISQGVKVLKQFTSSDGRVFNTFLIEDKAIRFIAKGVVHDTYSLEGEWNILKLVSGKDLPSPKLLFPDHLPHNFLLLEYIFGKNASELSLNSQDNKVVFKKVGATTGKLHSISVSSFGDLLHPTQINWTEYLRDKIQERLLGIESIAGEALYEKLVRLLKQLEPIIVSEKSNDPKLIHRDIYMDNFIISDQSNEAVLIDYAMALGGRPFYDLGKFYILELYRSPKNKSDFLDGYSQNIEIPSDFSDRLKLYIFKEALGMVYFFNKVGQKSAEAHAIQILNELADNNGVIVDLINEKY